MNYIFNFTINYVTNLFIIILTIFNNQFLKLVITTIFNICRRLDLSRFSAGSVLTLSISRNTLSPETLSALERTFLETGVEMLQLNCTSREELEDAILHPENHQDLIVRLYGYSARFTKLAPNQQREFIARHIY